jgi:hypothetical protein
MDFAIGDKVVQATDRGIPGLTLRVFTVTRAPFQSYGRATITVQQHNDRSYPRTYPADQFVLLTQERIDYLNGLHEHQSANEKNTND